MKIVIGSVSVCQPKRNDRVIGRQTEYKLHQTKPRPGPSGRSRVVNSGTNIFDSLTYRSDTGDYIGKFTFHTGVRYDVPGGGGGDCRGLGKMFLHQSTGRKKVPEPV